jgi:PAS domain-containing protein
MELALLLGSVMSSAPIGLAFFDAGSRCVRVNAALATMTGLPVADLLGRVPQSLIPNFGPRIAALVEQVLATGKATGRVELRGALMAGGPERRWLLELYPVAAAGAVRYIGLVLNEAGDS